jgi:hypothetical protein
MRRGTALLAAVALMVLAAAIPASAQRDGTAAPRATFIRCCFEVKVNVTFELDNSWHNPPSDFPGPTSHGFLVTWVADGLYRYVEHANGRTRELDPVGPAARIAAYLYDHDAGNPAGTCLRSLTTSGNVATWPAHWLRARTRVVQLGSSGVRIQAGPPFASHLAHCGGTFVEDVHSNTPAAKYGMQGPWSYLGHAPSRAQLRRGGVVVLNAYTVNYFTAEHGTPPHETDGHSNCILTFRPFDDAALGANIRAFNSRHPLNSKGFVPS